MPSGKKNKPIAGYHLLMILSAVDHHFTADEDRVIVDYLTENFPIPVSLDRELEVISALPEEEWLPHFKMCMDDFYEDSTEKERMELIKFAIELTKATLPITREENLYLSELYNEWTETVE